MSGLIKNNIDSSLKFVYSDNNTLSVIFHDNNLLLGVVGEFNKNSHKPIFTLEGTQY